jgi:hypothetical protein
MSGVTKTLFGGSDSKSKQKSNSALDPRLFNMFNQNYQSAQGVANNLGARQFAGFTPDWEAGAQGIRGTVNGAGMNSVNQAAAGAAAGAGYNPMMINQGSMDTNSFLNPYLQNVVGNTTNEMDRARQMAMQSLGANAAGSGAFGGSRHGIAEAETNRGYFDTLGNTIGQLYAGGYDNAQAAAMQAAINNQSAGLQGQQVQLQNNQLLSQLGQQQQTMGLQGNEALMNLGLAQQGLTQQQMDAIRNLPLEQQGLLNEALGINPGGGSGNVSTSSGTSTSSQQNGIFKSMGLGI